MTIASIFLAASTAVQVGDVRVSFSLAMGDGTNANSVVTVADMESLAVETNGNTIAATWRGHPRCGTGFSVSARFDLLPDGGFEYGGLSYSGNRSQAPVRRIAFPEIVVPRTDKTAIFRPRYTGEMFRPDWAKMKPGQKVFEVGVAKKAFNCMAAIEEDAESHFLDQRGDARLHASSFEAEVGASPDTLVLRTVYFPPRSERLREAGAMPYSGVYAPYRGGWYEAAKMHRRWLEAQPWFKAASARDFSKLREISLWMWSRGGVAVSEPPVHWFIKETGLKVGLDWYWWHNVPYDTAYPFFWPPRDGEDAFRAAVKRMRDAGAFVQAYTNGMLWDEDDSRWADGGIDCAIVEETGDVRSRTYNPFTNQRQAHMCGEAPKFQGKIRDLERKLASTGLDGVYMDMISCYAHRQCFNPRHSHAPGDANALIEGYRRLADAVRADNPGLLLSSEATSETYLDKFESVIVHYTAWERFGFGELPTSEPVPAISVIYRGACAMFGSFATPGGVPGWDPLWGACKDASDVEAIVAKYPDQFAVEFARGVAWGLQPTVHGFTMRDVANLRIAADVQFIKDTSRFYFEHRDFLFDGEMLSPARLECAAKRVEFLRATSYKRPHESKVCVQRALPAVFHSEWRAPDGRKAAVLVNWTREPQRYGIDFGGMKATGAIPALSWKLHLND